MTQRFHWRVSSAQRDNPYSESSRSTVTSAVSTTTWRNSARSAHDCGPEWSPTSRSWRTRQPFVAVLAPDTWSALEYTCHLRDVMLVQRERVLRALVEECPHSCRCTVTNASSWNTRTHRIRNAWRNSCLSRPGLLADLFAVLDDDQLERTGIYNYPAPRSARSGGSVSTRSTSVNTTWSTSSMRISNRRQL